MMMFTRFDLGRHSMLRAIKLVGMSYGVYASG
jgi:hypothetical protein